MALRKDTTSAVILEQFYHLAKKDVAVNKFYTHFLLAVDNLILVVGLFLLQQHL